MRAGGLAQHPHLPQRGVLGGSADRKLVEWRLMDFYRREGDHDLENWVPVDMAHLFRPWGSISRGV